MENIKKLSFSREKLNTILNDPTHTPEDILYLFNEDFQEIFDAQVGVWEKYSLREHTLMVMKQFKKYFGNKELPAGVDKKYMEVLLVLHDIGKPEAVADGKKSEQHEYTSRLLKPLLEKFQYTESEVKLAMSLINGEAIGHYLISGDLQTSVEKIIDNGKASGIPLLEFWELLKIYYQVDAGSYTKDAGGLESLDSLFSFNPETGDMSFSSKTSSQIQKLEEEIVKLS